MSETVRRVKIDGIRTAAGMAAATPTPCRPRRMKIVIASMHRSVVSRRQKKIAIKTLALSESTSES